MWEFTVCTCLIRERWNTQEEKMGETVRFGGSLGEMYRCGFVSSGHMESLRNTGRLKNSGKNYP